VGRQGFRIFENVVEFSTTQSLSYLLAEFSCLNKKLQLDGYCILKRMIEATDEMPILQCGRLAFLLAHVLKRVVLSYNSSSHHQLYYHT
jgi:hypothetical protein